MDCWQHNGDGRLEDNATAMQRRWSNATEMDGITVMDVATGNGDGHLFDGRLEDGVTATRWQWSNVTAVDGAKVMDVATATAMDGLSAMQLQ